MYVTNYPCKWLALLFDLPRNCSSIPYLETPQTDLHTNIAPSSRASVQAHFDRGSGYLESWLHGKPERAISQFQLETNLPLKTYELVTGHAPFEALFDDAVLIPQFQKVIDVVPEKWIWDALSNGVLKERIGEIRDITTA